MTPQIQVSALIVTYNPEPEVLAACLRSLASNGFDGLEVVLSDNSADPGVVERMELAGVTLKKMLNGRNLGFSGAINRALPRCDGEYVLIMNFDIELKEGCIGALVEALKSDEKAVGATPKMLFTQLPDVLDNTGILMLKNGIAFNRGVGSPDIGQYDKAQKIFGGCFGTVLIRKDAFKKNSVGPMDDRYFLYFEDVDWCLRANLMGRHFVYVPQAVVLHHHSLCTRDLSHVFKYRFIQRNMLLTVFKNNSFVLMFKNVLKRLYHLQLKARVDKEYTSATIRLVWEFLWLALFSLPARWRIQLSRKVGDDGLWADPEAERTFFDDVHLAPVWSMEHLIHVYRTKARVMEDERAGKIADALESAVEAAMPGRIIEILENEPEQAREFARRAIEEEMIG